MLRAAARLSVVVLLAASAEFVTATPCSACSCIPRTPKQLLHHADAAFVGTVVAEQPIDTTTTVQTFAVQGVFKGALGATVNVIEPIGSGGGSTCGIAYALGARVAVVLSRQGDGWTTDSCSLVSLADLEAVAPSPVPPRSGPSPSSMPTVTPLPPAPSPGLGWQAAVLGLLVGVAGIALALSLAGRRGRALGTEDPGSVDAEGPEEPPADPTTADRADPS